MAYDSQNAGYNTFNTVSVRLWSALPIFGNDYRKNTTDIINQLSQAQGRNQDQYKNIIEARKECEKITCAPYPKDPNQSIRIQELVIRQQYFFVAATLRDILRRFWKRSKNNWEKLPEKVALYILDVHHSIGILELLRVLIDDYKLTF